MQPNSYFIKISGKANIPEPLELGNGYKVALEGEITASSDFNLQDGTFDRTYTYRPALATVEDDKGHVVKAKDIRSNSTKLKRLAYHYWEADKDSNLSVDEDYDLVMKQVFYEFEEIRQRAYKKDR